MITKSFMIFCLLASTFVTGQNNDFSLTGTTTGIEDGTYLYLRDLANGGSLDSAMVRNNSFRFDTDLPEEKLFVMLHTADRSKFKELWLEDRPMELDGTGVPFPQAKVSGSRDQDLSVILKEVVHKDVINTSKEILKEREQKFIAQNPKSLVSAFVLDGAIRHWKQEEIGEYFGKLTEEIRTSSMGARVAKYLEKDLPEIGESYRDLSISDIEGTPRKLSELTGNLTLLQFWSSTCPGSRKMNKELAEIYREYAPKGFEVIGISKDSSKQAWQQAVEEDATSWPQLSNLGGWDGEAFSVYGVRSTPSNFLINQEGKIIARNLFSEELKKELQNYLQD